MYFIPSNLNFDSDDYSSSYYIFCGIFLIILIASFYFRDYISGVKENVKKNIRGYLRPIFFKVDGDTVSTVKQGPLQSVWVYLDTYFLTPSEPSSSYDYIGSDDEDEEGEYDEDEEGEDEGEGEGEGEDEEDGDGKYIVEEEEVIINALDDTLPIG
jgi:hypothetical protein